MPNTLRQTERIKYKTELLKLLTILMLAIGGGSVGIALGTLTPVRIALAAVGIAFTAVTALVVAQQHWTIERLIEHIGEEES